MAYSPQSKDQTNFPLLFMGLLYVAAPLFELLFPPIAGGDRLPIKLLNGFQIAFALLIFIFRPVSMIGFRWLHLSMFLLCVWLSLAGFALLGSPIGMLYRTIMFLYWYSLFLFFYNRFQFSSPRCQRIFIYLVFVSILIWLLSIVNAVKINREIMGYQSQNYSGYYLAALFPYLLLMNSKIFKGMAIALIAFGSVYSLKRGVVLALVLMGLSSTFFYFSTLTAVKKKIAPIIVVSLVWILSIGSGLIFAHSHREIIERRISKDSGRSEIYSYVLEAQTRSEIYEWIVGHGAMTIKADTGHYAHNDWLMLLYEYGFIGILLLLNLYMSLMALIWKLYRMKSPLVMSLAAVCILMFCIQLYSIGLTLKIFGFMTGGIGIIAGRLSAQRRLQFPIAF